jgi:hypothetical protein
LLFWSIGFDAPVADHNILFNVVIILSLQNTVVMAFLQYYTEAIPGKPLKRKVTQEETRELKKQYEKDRERKFIDSWKQEIPRSL